VRPRPVRSRRLRPRRIRKRGSVRHPWLLRRIALAVALLAVVIVPLPVLASDVAPHPPGCAGPGCRTQAIAAWRWAVRLTGTWSAGGTGAAGTASGDGGTVPAAGQAYVAAGDRVAVLGAGLDLDAFRLTDGRRLWQTALAAPAGTVIMSVRAWPAVVTVGLLAPDARSRTEVVLDADTGKELRRYPAAVFGGAVAASAAATVVIGPSAVTSYENTTGRVRWRHQVSGSQSWQAAGGMLYVAQSAGGSLSSVPVTALKIIDLGTGTEGTLSSPPGRPFAGTLALAAGGAVLFASSAGVTAYSGSTGAVLWAMAGAVPEGTDPAAGLVYVTSPGGTLRGVDSGTGVPQTSVPASVLPGSGNVYAVRDGTAFGLSSGSSGAAWGFSTTANRISWTSVTVPWPHFYSDLSGLGGSAAASGDTVVVTACPHLIPAAQLCANPELVAFSL
jgi:hypothetical protein